VTYHGPGQLVVYPLIDLRRYKQDLHWYVRRLEEVLLLVLRRHGLRARRDAGRTGIWLDQHTAVGDNDDDSSCNSSTAAAATTAAGGHTSVKLAAIGINVSRWKTMHGLALNVCPRLEPFDEIVPCGIDDAGVGSMHTALRSRGITDEVLVDTGVLQTHPNDGVDRGGSAGGGGGGGSNWVSPRLRADVIAAFEDVFGMEATTAGDVRSPVLPVPDETS
jgi:lipoate-protein ligase B